MKYRVVLGQWGLAKANSAKSVTQPRKRTRRTVLGIKEPSVCAPRRVAVHLITSAALGGGGGTMRTSALSVIAEWVENAGLGNPAEYGPDVKWNLAVLAVGGSEGAAGLGNGISVEIVLLASVLCLSSSSSVCSVGSVDCSVVVLMDITCCRDERVLCGRRRSQG